MNTAERSDRRVLIVDDEPDFLVLLKKVISKQCNCSVELASSAVSALTKVKEWCPDVVLTDIQMPDMDGLELLAYITQWDSTITPVIMTGYGTIEMAVQALRDGAYDFHQKPFDNDKIVGSINNALERTHLLRENRRLQQEITKPKGNTGFVGESQRLRNTVELLSRLASSSATVLIRGESGTGKEVAAKALHSMSKRADKKMVTVNCPALPEPILESELFGYVKGAFTGAESDKDGLFLEASGSTILLDEVADIPITLQTKLLRVLQEKEIQPLGQTKTIKVDVRVLASTNQNLEEKMLRGEFREDLFYRLNVMQVTLPPLSEIAEDIPLLAHHFLKEFEVEYDRKGLNFSSEALQYLLNKRWKGNVRQLKNTINRASLLCTGKTITIDDLHVSPSPTPPVSTGERCVHQFLKENYKEAKEKTLQDFTMAYLHRALTENSGNVSAAAKKSGMDRQTFQRLMRKYDVVSELFRS